MHHQYGVDDGGETQEADVPGANHLDHVHLSDEGVEDSDGKEFLAFHFSLRVFEQAGIPHDVDEVGFSSHPAKVACGDAEVWMIVCDDFVESPQSQSQNPSLMN